ncbi:hypothetical protein M8312_13500 [Sphingomonas sp. KRR8]|uniref:hypothetical protein n=1 Tax=Sphingomonas sp. KRR8 TaxID=2942996 RepID=UPI00202252DF|nr:hypothetical protein [Sphingomonas sp. KRR8]URD60773.1 hypothetical protein M8312_13500 [Sphingomonas sp. KRR8]
MSATASGLLLREVPHHLLTGVSSGEFRVYGSIIRSLTSGQIVGHLQETAALSNLALKALSAPASLPLQGANIGVDVIGHAVSYAQNEQMKAAIGVLQNMQVANLALSAAGIGVSVAGFAVIAAKIARVEKKVEALGDKLDKLSKSVEALRQDRILDDFSALRTTVEQMDEGWLLGQPDQSWREVARQSHSLWNGFQRRAIELLGRGDLIGADPFVEAFALSASTRVQARLASGDDLVARRAAEESASALIKMGEHVKLGVSVLKEMETELPQAGSAAWGEALETKSDRLRGITSSFRQREQAAAASVMTLVELDRQQITGRAWLEAARQEQESPLLCLPVLPV